MAWPAWWKSGTEGTVYVGKSDMHKAIEGFGKTGQAWKYGHEWTTYRPNGKVLIKNVDRLQPKSEEDFWHIMQSCQSANMNPPTSFADCFMSLYSPPRPCKSVIAPLLETISGGWEEAIDTGWYRDRVWHYDIRKAYRWSACRGLPDPKTACVIFKLEPEYPYAIYRVEMQPGQLSYQRIPGRVWITAEEYEACWPKPTITYGMGFQAMVNLSPVFDLIDARFPYCHDRISRAFWGMWAARQGPEQHSWKRGPKHHTLPNPFYNPIWALVITSRIKLRVQEHVNHTLHCFIDSILSTEEIPTGEGIGDWRLVDSFQKGVWVKGPGYWGDASGPVKSSGHRREG